MRNIVDIGKKGAESIGREASGEIKTPIAQNFDENLNKIISVAKKFPVERMPVEVSDGAKHEVGVHKLVLSNQGAFSIAWHMAPYEPMVYARHGNKAVMGMLSPNYDTHGHDRNSTLKVLPLLNPYPLTKSGTNLFPDAQMATMLAGSARSEGQGSGGCDSKSPAKDMEHRFTMLGAVSLGKKTITENGKHIQHGVRESSSVAAAMTNGKLGNMFVPGGDDVGGFTGYGEPIIFDQSEVSQNDIIYIPEAFLDDERAFGASYKDASRIQYGAGLQVLAGRIGLSGLNGRINRIMEDTN